MSEQEQLLARFLSEECPECGTPGFHRHLSAVAGCKTCADSDPRPVFIWPDGTMRTPLRLPRECYRTDAGFIVHVKPECRCRR